MKKLDIKEFRELGYLQELNRRFLHPLGLALEVTIDNAGIEYLSGIQDYREDDEGAIFDLKASNQERLETFKTRIEFIDSEMLKRSKVREEKLGYIIEPIC